jgi:hypothetical protein
MVAMLIATFLFLGIIATLIQSRRITESSVAQNAALSAVESYVEQMKSMTSAQLNTNPIPTQLNYNTNATLAPSTGTPPLLSSFTPGTTPTGITDNLQDIPSNVNNPGAAVAWTTLWPNAQNFPTGGAANAYRNDLHLDIWVWINNLTPTYPSTASAYGITIIYTWQFWNGFGNEYHVNSLRTICAANVQSFTM